MSRVRTTIFCPVVLVSNSLYAGAFKPKVVDMQELLTFSGKAGCLAIESKEPDLENKNYQQLWSSETDYCQKYSTAYGAMNDLSATDERIRYVAIRALYSQWSKVGDSAFHSAFNAFGKPGLTSHMGSSVKSQLTLMATADKSHIADYAKFMARPSLSQLPLAGLDLTRRRIAGELCYHSAIEDSDMQGSTWDFTVTRFCNFQSVKADDAHFTGFFYQQTFQDSSFQNTTWDLRIQNFTPSVITFRNADLRNAQFTGDVCQLKFIESDLTGARINGSTCLDKEGSGCWPIKEP